MARPIKQGLDYFPLDTDMDTDDKIVLIEGRYGIEGYGAVVKLYSKIYKEGYYYQWSEKELLLFAQRTRLEEPFVDKVVKDCLKWGIFNEKLFKKYGILTSSGIQKRYFKAIERRLKINVYKEYILNGVLDNINSDNVNINSVNDDISTQRKGKYKESKVLKEKFPVDNYENVLLSEDEMEKLLKDLGTNTTNDLIERLHGYIEQIGHKEANKKYKSHYATILNWHRRDVKGR